MKSIAHRFGRRARAGFGRQRRGAIAVTFAMSILPIILCCGLAIDYASWNEARAAVNRAANSAAMNAVKIAYSAQNEGSLSYAAQGQTAGQKWFTAQLGTTSLGLSTTSAQVAITYVSTMTATVTYSGSVTSIFGGIASVLSYPLNLTVTTTMATTPYVEIQVLIDNSSSMLIGATQTDMLNVEMVTMCSTQGGNADPNNGTVDFAGYMCSYNGYTATSCPITTPSSAYPVTTITPNTTFLTAGGGPSCQYWPGAVANSDGTWPTGGAPCAFACHSDNTGQGHDPYGLVRASSTPITLRLDAVKTAINSLISLMSASNNSNLNNLSIGIWDFNTAIEQDYPTTGAEAGSNWTAAQTAVGGNLTGIQPSLTTGSNPDTDFNLAMNYLANHLTSSGSGGSALTPSKMLFIVTDGMLSSPEAGIASGAFSASECTLMKNKGYTVFVIYTPYYSLPHISWNVDAAPLTQPLTNSTVSQALQACASSPSNYLSATDQTSLTAALKTFLTIALTVPAYYSN